MTGSNEDRGRSRRLGAEDWRWSSTGRVLGGRMIERSGDAVCGLHRARGDDECRFLGLASKPRWTVCQWFCLKTTGMGLVIWATKSPHEFLSWASKSRSTVSSGLASKPVAMISPGLVSKLVATVLMVWPQNHSLWFPSLDLKIDSYGLVIWPIKSLQQFLGLGLKTKWAMVYQLYLKTDGRMKTA
jgi:hypothetical protein